MSYIEKFGHKFKNIYMEMGVPAVFVLYDRKAGLVCGGDEKLRKMVVLPAIVAANNNKTSFQRKQLAEATASTTLESVLLQQRYFDGQILDTAERQEGRA